MDEILKQILDKLKSLEQGQKETNNRIDNLEFNIGELKTDVKDLRTDSQQIKQAVLETNDTAKRIESRQEHQQKVIEQLAYKSVEHDAEIKRIK